MKTFAQLLLALLIYVPLHAAEAPNKDSKKKLTIRFKDSATAVSSSQEIPDICTVKTKITKDNKLSPHAVVKYKPSGLRTNYQLPNSQLQGPDLMFEIARHAQQKFCALYVCYHFNDHSHRFYPDGRTEVIPLK